MRHVRSGLRPAFALFVIAHGLAHTVLPMRGWVNPEMLGRDFMPVILYGVAILGLPSPALACWACARSPPQPGRCS